jgi:hypothetical protein
MGLLHNPLCNLFGPLGHAALLACPSNLISKQDQNKVVARVSLISQGFVAQIG